MVPWIVANPGVAIADVAERFGVSEAELVDDLHVVWMVGLPPYTPDALVEVVMEDGRVWIHYADFFSRPLRLTPAQGLAMLAASDALLSLPGTDPDGPLARALAKLGAALGVDVDEALDVDLGGAGSEHLEPLRTSIADGTDVEIDYFSYSRDELTSRRISPWRMTANGGAWYVEGWCHRAGGERLFRLDRIARLVALGEPSDHPAPPDGRGSDAPLFRAEADQMRVTLRLPPDAAWVVEAYPTEAVDRADDGTTTVTLAVSTARWLERLLLRLGPDTEVVAERSFPGATDLRGPAARRVLARYRS